MDPIMPGDSSSPPTPSRSGLWLANWPAIGLMALIAVFISLSNEVTIQNAITLDEYGHVPAGVSYWDLGRFYLYRENPPVVQALAALPVWLSGAKMDYSRARSSDRSEWDVGVDFARANAAQTQRYFLRARSVIVLLAIACGVLVFRWSRDLFGPMAGLVSAALWFLDPVVMAFSTIVTSDIGAALFGCLAAYAFFGFLRNPNWKKVMSAGIALGLAQGSKFSLLVLFPAFLITAILERRSSGQPRHDARLGRRDFWLRFSAILGIGLLTLNVLYEFDGTGKPLRSFAFKSWALSGLPSTDARAPRFENRFRGSILGDCPVPLPKDYLIGLDSQKWDEQVGFPRLSGGRLVTGGRWYEPFIILGEKLPLGTLILSVAALAIILTDLSRRRLIPWAVWIPAASMIGLLCSQTGLNWIVRYHLIWYPFLFIATGRLARAAEGKKWASLLIAACLLWDMAALFRARPDYLAYGNELIGGSVGAQRTLLGSNFDWGQDLLQLKDWYDRHPEAQPLALSYHGFTDPQSIGIRTRPLPICFDQACEVVCPGGQANHDETFYWAISSNVLNGLAGSIFLEDGTMRLGLVRSTVLKPENAVARIGQTIFVFRIGSGRDQPAARNSISVVLLHGCTDLHSDADHLVSP